MATPVSVFISRLSAPACLVLIAIYIVLSISILWFSGKIFVSNSVFQNSFFQFFVKNSCVKCLFQNSCPIFYKSFIDYQVILEMCLMASKSARMRRSAHLKAVTYSYSCTPNFCSKIVCLKIRVSFFCCKKMLRRFLFQNFRFKIPV